ncbi:MAG TPA: redoxin domain-containing protein, partial [Armatimonadota bacterium]|nr:redoxin domain-containing protein [Armatimonadota bacterium]
MTLRLGTAMPPLSGGTEWVNSEPLDSDQLLGKPVLVHFWALSCHSCHGMMPTILQWHAEYAPRGLQMIAVHQPRMETDMDVDAVRREVAEYGITYPVVVDNEQMIGRAWDNRFVPSFFVFDRDGKLRHY